MSLARNLYHFPDSNGFVSMFVVDALLESYELGAIEDTNDLEIAIQSAVKSILSHRDINTTPGSSIFTFWNQALKNGTGVSDPPNISIPVGEIGSALDFITEGLDKLGLKDAAKVLEALAKFPNTLLNVFRIPADFDDSGCGIALGARIKKSNAFPSAKTLWNSQISSLDAILDAAVKYAYYPFANDDSALIDPRTYFWMRDFLHSESNSGNTNLALVPTWLQNLSESKKLSPKGIKAPFNVNNVDASVAANFLHGIITSSLLDPEVNFSLLNKPEVQLILSSTTRLLAWTIKSDALSKRPDLVLLYYPPIYDFYWFVSRIVVELKNSPVPLLDVLQDMKNKLFEAMSTAGTDQILKRAQSDATSVRGATPTHYYWDDFLGAIEKKKRRPSI